MNSDLIFRLDEIVAKYPPQIQFSPERASELQGLSLFAIIRIHLEYLQNRFLLERVKHSHTHANGQELLDSAIAMMETVLSLWLRRDQLHAFIAYFDWFVR